MAVYRDKKRGTWYVSLYYTDWTGKQQRKLKRGFSTKKEAQDWERHFSLEKASSLDMTFGDFYKRYTDDVKPKLRENTWKSKEYVIELKILPYFKDLVMREITPRDVIAWQNEMRKCESQDGEKYKGTYLRKMQAELSAIFNHAVKYYELPKNPAVIAGPLGQHHADEMLFWTKEEYMRFIPEVANKTYSYMAFELLYWCGIRIGELMALTPADFDFDKNKLSITKSYQRISGRDVITKPKTPKSVRMISMPENVALEMKDFLDSIYGIEPSDRIFVISKSYLHHEMDRGVSFTDKPMKRAPRLRVHFAAGYFDAKTSDKTIQRVNNVRNAFNSPFRPFVLATTSVGQEGLDFHLYSRKVVHWNLPNNPIDLEQREGRINRYMCHAIRQNVAANEDEPDWNDKFDATREKYGANSSEMIPYWCLPEDYPYKYQIERIVPMYPFSQDKTKYDRLINVLALYRLTLGQPRQEEMISILQREDLSSEQMEELFFDLSPYSRKQKNKG